jgi:hypothetical protein
MSMLFILQCVMVTMIIMRLKERHMLLVIVVHIKEPFFFFYLRWIILLFYKRYICNE